MNTKIFTIFLLGLIHVNAIAQVNTPKVQAGLILIEKLNAYEYTEMINSSFIKSKAEMKIDKTWILDESFNNYEILEKEYKTLELKFNKYKFNYKTLKLADSQIMQASGSDSSHYFIKHTITFFEDGNYLGLRHSFILLNYKNQIIFDEGAKRLAKRIRDQ